LNPANEYQVASNHHDVGTELPETQRRDVVTSRWEPLSARLRLLVLTVLTVLAALLLPALHASASGLPAAETRVGAISPTVSTVVGVAEHIAAGQHLGRAPSQLRLVSGHCVAAETADGAIAIGSAPENAWSVLDRVVAKKSPFPGYKGGGGFANDGREGSQILPRSTSGGDAITYQEWDVNPYVKGVDRGDERIVTGSDGSAYYTSDHYKWFTQFWGSGG